MSGNACAKSQEKTNSYHGQRLDPQISENKGSDRKSRMHAGISASIFAGFKSDRTLLGSFKAKSWGFNTKN